MQCEEKMITHDVPLLNLVRKAGPPVHSWDNQTNTTCGCPSDCKDNLIFEPSIIICNDNENTFTANNAKEKKTKQLTCCCMELMLPSSARCYSNAVLDVTKSKGS